MEIITKSQIWQQLRRDLIGKDSQRGVTLTYSWLANQFGHFSLGFIPTFIVYLIIVNPANKQASALWAALGVGAFWVLFETYNLLGPLLLKRRFKTVVRFRQKVFFAPDWRNLAYDTITDLGFFLTGACTAGLIMAYSKVLLIILFILLGFLLIASSYWYVTKIYLQAAQYPFQFRLSQWEKVISNQNKLTIEDFRNKKDKGHHLFVFGPANAGKSALSVGIATEVSIRHGACLYATAMKLFRMFFESPDSTNGDTLWTWHKAGLLVIDDVNAGDPVHPDVISPDAFSRFLQNEKHGNSNILAFREKNVIWVLGNEDPKKIQQHEECVMDWKSGVDPGRKAEGTWVELLRKIDVEKEKISIVNLGRST